MDFQRMILLFMEYCASKQLRPKTMHAYEKTLRLFAKWLQENEEITKADAVKEMHIRRYLLELQSRGKYTACSDEHSKKINFPENRSDSSVQASAKNRRSGYSKKGKQKRLATCKPLDFFAFYARFLRRLMRTMPARLMPASASHRASWLLSPVLGGEEELPATSSS